jgi:hypothetical protein
MGNVIRPLCDEGVVRAKKVATPCDPALGTMGAGGEAASAWERSLSVRRCSYFIESVWTAYGAEPA